MAGTTQSGEAGALPSAMGRYVPLARLGTGGMAEVYLAVSRGPSGLSKLAVLKRVKRSEDPAMVEMFVDEARLAARLNHPNIVHTYEVGDVAERHFIAMEYIEGHSLHALMAQRPGLPETIALYIAAQALRGLHHAHDLADFDGKPLGVVHRDVSPHNIHLTYGGEVKVLDFGIAKTSLNSTHTETGILKGKIRYMAPEQFGEREIDRRVDVFACGVVLWEMLAGKALFPGDAGRAMSRIVNDDAPSVTSVRPDVSPAIDGILKRALARDRADRYPSADAMFEDVDRVLRANGGGSPDKRLAQLMNEVFGATREELRHQIKRYLDAAPDPSDPNAETPGTSAPELPILGSSSENPVTASRPSQMSQASAVGVAASMSPMLTPPRSNRGLLIGAAALAVAALAIGASLHQPSAATAASAAAAAPPASAHVKIAPVPSGAATQVDGKSMGTTPAEFDLPAGRRTLTLAADGFVGETLPLDVQPGTGIDREISLRAAPPSSGTAHTPRPPVPVVAPPPQPRPTFHSHSAPAAPAAGSSSAPAPRVKIRVLDDSDSP